MINTRINTPINNKYLLILYNKYYIINTHINNKYSEILDIFRIFPIMKCKLSVLIFGVIHYPYDTNESS